MNRKSSDKDKSFNKGEPIIRQFIRAPKVYYFSFFTITIALIVISLCVFFCIKADITDCELKKYSQINSLQSNLISKFISERMLNSYMINENIYAHNTIRNIYYSPQVNETTKREWFAKLNRNNDYHSIVLYDTSLKLVYAIYDKSESLIPPSDFFFEKAISQKTPILCQPYIYSHCRMFHLDIITPIINNSKTSFLILLRMNLMNYIIPKINELNVDNFDSYSVILFSDSFAVNIRHKIELMNFDSSVLRKIKTNEGLYEIPLTINLKDYYIISSKIKNTE
ncbi:MAG: hypothetical protein COX48_04315 [bacterium (Candidatus Stahlbacteria) CG23_combo_of_CG06-09_8_20_14_all_34_7]|nr:MAG: hypothetical protein COX48_04315 [bacterium (Candidatus Stahlbacteria) CG23_combo_of_CG06-09_8_20_14_all_34_7]